MHWISFVIYIGITLENLPNFAMFEHIQLFGDILDVNNILYGQYTLLELAPARFL